MSSRNDKETNMGQPEIMDLNTAEGCAAWMKELPTENLRAIAARPVDQFNALIVAAADCELVLREPPAPLAPYPATCPTCRGTGGGQYNDCPSCDGNGVV